MLAGEHIIGPEKAGTDNGIQLTAQLERVARKLSGGAGGFYVLAFEDTFILSRLELQTP
jgi:hypothetical protein